MNYTPFNPAKDKFPPGSEVYEVIIENGEKCKAETGANINWLRVIGYKPIKIASGHNLFNLTEEEVGTANGYRLLEEHEIVPRPTSNLIEVFDEQKRAFKMGHAGDSINCVYRTWLSKTQLHFLSEGWEPYFPLFSIIFQDIKYDFMLKNHKVLYNMSYREALSFTSKPNTSQIVSFRVTKSKDYIPWTYDTLPSLGFEVQHILNKKKAIVIQADTTYCIVGGEMVTYQDLFEKWKQVNGKPCGKIVGNIKKKKKI